MVDVPGDFAPGSNYSAPPLDWLSPDAAASPLQPPRREAPNGRVVLDIGTPLKSAREFISSKHTIRNIRAIHHQNGVYYGWSGDRYIEVSGEEVRANIYRFLDGAFRLQNRRLVPFDPNKSKVANLIDATAAEAQLPTAVTAPAWLDRKERPPATEIVACKNGLLHLPTRRLLEHTPLFFNLNALEFAYDPDAAQPNRWLNFLTELWPHDPQSISVLQEMFGLFLTGDTRYQKAFLIVGPKRSGKGTLARVMTLLLGQANVCGPTLSGLATNFGLAPLIGKRLAIVSDARLGGKTDQQVIVERILAITGEDSLSIDRKFRDAWTGRLQTRFLLLSNELPRLGDASGALASRFVTLVMRESFYGREDLGLTERLAAELPSILIWALTGWDRLKARGYCVSPATAADATREMEDLGSPIGAFLRDCCVIEASQAVECTVLFNSWVRWCRANNRDHPGTVQGFGRDLRAAVPGLDTVQPRTEDGPRTRYYQGIGLRR